MTTPEQTRSRVNRGAKSLIVATAALCLVASFSGHAGADHGGLNQDGGPAIDPTIESYETQNGLSGKMNIAGSNTMRPLLTRLAAQFMGLHPSTQIVVEGTGSGAAVREFLLGISYQRRGDKVRGRGTAGANSVEVLACSRQLTDQELKGFKSNYGYVPIEVPIAMDAVAIYVNKDNTIQRLTMAEVDAIFSREHRRGHAPINTWGQIDKDGPLAVQPLHLYGRDKRSGTREFFKHVALKDGELHEMLVEQPGSASEIIAIAQDPLAIGYAGIGFQISAVRPLPIAGENGRPAVLPSQDSVQTGTYPLARSLYLYVNKDPKEELEGLVREFLAFVNSRQGQETVARASFFPMTGTQVAKNRQMLGLSKSALARVPAREDGQQIAERLAR